MMFAHLTIAGAAEVIVSAGVVAYLQRSNPGLLEATARETALEPSPSAVGGWFGTRWLWTGLGALMVLSPLGLLATGIAWGEWGSRGFCRPGRPRPDRRGLRQHRPARERAAGAATSLQHLDSADPRLCAELHAP